MACGHKEHTTSPASSVQMYFNEREHPSLTVKHMILLFKSVQVFSFVYLFCQQILTSKVEFQRKLLSWFHCASCSHQFCYISQIPILPSVSPYARLSPWTLLYCKVLYTQKLRSFLYGVKDSDDVWQVKRSQINYNPHGSQRVWWLDVNQLHQFVCVWGGEGEGGSSPSQLCEKSLYRF